MEFLLVLLALLDNLIESLKHYMAVKMNLDNPDFVNDNGVVSDMMSPKFAAELKTTIYDNMTFDPKHYGRRWNILQDHGTSHLSIIDSERNAASMTSTINSYFGSLNLSQVGRGARMARWIWVAGWQHAGRGLRRRPAERVGGGRSRRNQHNVGRTPIG
ncbi:glutathione hydrolase 1-like [Setaria italica]|uniref:glutathione hydrolase 1-like n=1 Tax=Setaria italica TaxID=4555 RepID=UPI000BE4FE06|nr:glutathione hydrolase 1-like [Setaria italica]